jgi:predicted ester cyclase
VSLDSNKALVRRAYLEGMNNHDWSVIDEVFAPDYVVRYPGVPPIRGLADAKAALSAFLDAFPDMVFSIDDQLAEGDKVVTRWSGRGTHAGVYRGFPEAKHPVPPTGRPVEFSATDIYLIRGGKIVEEWNTMEEILILQRIGALPK